MDTVAVLTGLTGESSAYPMSPRRVRWRPAKPCEDQEHQEQREAMQEVDAALEAWARWGRSLLQSIGWPSWTVLARVMEQGFQGAAQGGGRAFEVDEAMELIERAVLRLPEKERLVVIKHYTYWEPIEVSARYCHMHPATFRRCLHQARRSIRDFLEGVRRTCVRTKTRV